MNYNLLLLHCDLCFSSIFARTLPSIQRLCLAKVLSDSIGVIPITWDWHFWSGVGSRWDFLFTCTTNICHRSLLCWLRNPLFTWLKIYFKILEKIRGFCLEA